MYNNDNDFNSSFSNLVDSLNEIRKGANVILPNMIGFANTISELIKPFYENVKMIREVIADSIPTEFFRGFTEVIQKAYNDPSSFINYVHYQDQLNSFHWAWPFQIQPEEIKRLLEEANNEEQFDKLIASFFTKKRMNNMFDYICDKLPRRHIVIFRQIMQAYDEKQYALINNAAISILDNLLSIVLKNKGCVTRKGILHPVIEFYADNYSVDNTWFLFELQMLSNNIDLIFENYDFNNINIDSSKKVRRHLSAHGFMYSNKKIDSIMILNTIAALLNNMVYIEPFKGTLKCDRTKKFIFDTKDYVIKNRIKKRLSIFE